MKNLKIINNPYVNLILNFIYAIANCILGFLNPSWWFITVGAYYAVLTVTRYCVFTGTSVWLVVLLLGINLTGGRYTDMAKSKIIKANEKIADAVSGGYKKIEKGVVEGYTKIEDKFVDAYLTKDGETVEEAKERLKKQNK